MAENTEAEADNAAPVVENEHNNETTIEATGLDLSKFAAEFTTNDLETIVGGKPEAGENPAADDDVSEPETAAETPVVEEPEAGSNEEVLAEENHSEITNESIRKLLLKIDGKEVEEEIPFDLPPEAIEYMTQKLQLANVSQKRMQESAEVKKNFDSFINDFKGNPEKIMEELGMNSQEFAEAVIQRKIEELQKSPEQLAQEKKDTELTALRERIAKMEQEEKDKSLEMERKADLDAVTREIDEALDEFKTLPKTEFVRQQVANMWHNYLSNGQQVTAKEVVGQVHSQLKDLFANVTESLGDEAFEQYVGQKNTSRYTKSKLAPKKVESLSNIKEVAQPKDKVVEKKKKINMQDWLRNRGGTLSDMIKK